MSTIIGSYYLTSSKVVYSMKGIFNVEVYDSKESYSFTLYRKITVLCGDSGTGKSSLIRLIERVTDNKIRRNCKLTSSVDIITFSNAWKSDSKYTLADRIRSYSGVIFIIDEKHLSSLDNDSAKAINKSDNYFLLITRDSIKSIAYSVDSIVELSTVGKNHTFIKSYDISLKSCKPTMIITEDSNSGYEFFSNMCYDKTKCISSNGNSNIEKTISSNIEPGRMILVIVDSSAFGPFIKSIDQIGLYYNFTIWFIESFEWLLLTSKMFIKDKEIANIIANPTEYIDTSYISWEQYFTELIINKTRGTDAQYSKSKLSCCYKDDCCCKVPCPFIVRGSKIDSILGEYYDMIDFSDIRSDVIGIDDPIQMLKNMIQ